MEHMYVNAPMIEWDLTVNMVSIHVSPKQQHFTLDINV